MATTIRYLNSFDRANLLSNGKLIVSTETTTSTGATIVNTEVDVNFIDDDVVETDYGAIVTVQPGGQDVVEETATGATVVNEDEIRDVVTETFYGAIVERSSCEEEQQAYRFGQPGSAFVKDQCNVPDEPVVPPVEKMKIYITDVVQVTPDECQFDITFSQAITIVEHPVFGFTDFNILVQDILESGPYPLDVLSQSDSWTIRGSIPSPVQDSIGYPWYVTGIPFVIKPANETLYEIDYPQEGVVIFV